MTLMPTAEQMLHLDVCSLDLIEAGAPKDSKLWKIGMHVASHLEEIRTGETQRECEVIFDAVKHLIKLASK